MSRECRCTVCLLLPAAAAAAGFLFPLAWARGQLKDKRMGHWRERGERGEVVKKDREREKVSELRGLGQKRNRKDGAVCLGRRRTWGGVLKETGQCVEGEWIQRRGRGRGRGACSSLCVQAESLFKAVQWSQSAFCLLIRSGGLEEVKELERVFLSASVSLLPAAVAALKETWTGLSVSLCSALLQRGRPFTMKGTGVSPTAGNTHTERRDNLSSLLGFEFRNKLFISVHFLISLHHVLQ